MILQPMEPQNEVSSLGPDPGSVLGSQDPLSLSETGINIRQADLNRYTDHLASPQDSV